MRALPVLLALFTLLAPAAAANLVAPVPLAAALSEDALLARADAVLDHHTLAGKTPRGWLAWAEARLHEAPGAQGEADLAPALLALYDAVGVARADSAALDDAVRQLDPAWASALAPLVAEVAAAYDSQEAIAATLDLETFAARDGAALSPDATALGAANAERVLAAIASFRAQAAVLPPVEGFADPLGLVVLGTSGNDVFVQGTSPFADPVLLVDAGGDDLDLTRSGGACAAPVGVVPDCNGLALSVRLDLAGDDTYRYAGPHEVAQGSGAFGGLGILVDVAGNDLYDATQLVTYGVFATYYINGVMQGAGEAGLGVLIDLAGDDDYLFTGFSSTRELFGFGQGFAGLGGLGVLLDGSGEDLYDARVTCTGFRNQFCGLYVQSTVIYPGVSVQLDAGPESDVYRGILVAPYEDYYSQGFAAFGGFAILVDQGGDEDYLATATSTDTGSSVSLNCAFGTAEYAGAVGIMIDGGGDDRYVTETIAVNPPLTMAEGFSLASFSLFWDVRGDDWHEMRAIGPNAMMTGRGTGGSAIENSAVYLDTGGIDTYVDPIGEDGSVWGPPGSLGIGVDVNLFGNVVP